MVCSMPAARLSAWAWCGSICVKITQRPSWVGTKKLYRLAPIAAPTADVPCAAPVVRWVCCQVMVPK